MNFLIARTPDARYISQAARDARDWYNNESTNPRWGTELSELLRDIHVTDHLQNLESRTHFDFQANCQMQVQQRSSPLDFTFEPGRLMERPARIVMLHATFPDRDIPSVNEITFVVTEQSRIFTEEDIVARECNFGNCFSYVEFEDGTKFTYDPAYRTRCGVAGAVLLSTDRRYAGGFIDVRCMPNGEGLLYERANIRLHHGSNTRHPFIFNWYCLPGPGYFGIGTLAQ